MLALPFFVPIVGIGMIGVAPVTGFVATWLLADAPPAVLALMIAVGIVLGSYGWSAARQESDAREVPLAHGA